MALWGGAVSCLVNALVGPLSLVWAGILPVSSLGPNVFTWWLGDALGVSCLGPLFLLILDRSPGERVRRTWMVAGVQLAVFAAVVLGVNILKDADRSVRERSFHHGAGEVQKELEEALRDDRLVLDSLAPISGPPERSRTLL